MSVNNLVNIKIKAVENLSDKLGGIKKSTKWVEKGLDNMKRKLENMKPTFQKMAWYGAVAFGALTVWFNKTINNAVDLWESINAVNVVFGEGSDIIKDFWKTASTSVWLANSEFNQLSTETGTLLKASWLEIKEVANNTVDLTKRASDLASVFNTDVQTSMSAINQALRWETEAIRKFGSDVTDASLEQFLLAQWIEKSASKMTQQEKILYRMQKIIADTNQVTWDFANTSDSLANRQRILSSQIQDASAKFWELLIPVKELVFNAITPLLSKLTEFIEKNPKIAKGIAIATTAIAWITAVFWTVGLLLPVIIAGFTALTPLIAWVGAVIGAILSPIWLVVWWIVWLIALFKDGFSVWIERVVKIWDVIWKFWGFFIRTVVNLWKAWVGFLMDVMENAIKIFWAIVNNTVVFAKNTLKAITSVNWGEAWAWLQEWFWRALENIVNYARKIWGKIKNFFKKLLTWKDANIIDKKIMVQVWNQADAMFEEYQWVFDNLDFSRTSAAIGDIWADFQNTFWGVSSEAEKSSDAVSSFTWEINNAIDSVNNFWDNAKWGASKAKEGIKEAKEETFTFNEALKKVSDTAIRLSWAVYEKFGKGLGMIEAQEVLDGLEQKFKSAFWDNNALISETENKIKSLKGEIEGIEGKLASLREQRDGVGTDERSQLAERALELEKKLKEEELNTIEKRKVKQELAVASEKAGINAIQEAREWADMSETERIIIKAEQRRADINTQIAQQEKLLNTKTLALSQEETKLTELQELKIQFENQYHSLFQKNMTERQISIEKSIKAMKRLNALSGGGSGGGSVTWARATGWPVVSGSTYRVNEQGQEFFTPKQSGTITPAGQSTANININMWGIVVQKEADENRLVDKIKQALKQETKAFNYWIV